MFSYLIIENSYFIFFDISWLPVSIIFMTLAYSVSHLDSIGCVFKIDFQTRNTSVFFI